MIRLIGPLEIGLVRIDLDPDPARPQRALFQYITTVLWAPTQSDEGSHPVLHDWARPRVVLATRPVHTRCKSSGHSMRTRLWGVAAPSTQEFWAAFSSRREQESNRARRLQGSAPLPSRCTQLQKSSDFKFSVSSHTLTNIVLTHPTQRGRTWISALQLYWNGCTSEVKETPITAPDC